MPTPPPHAGTQLLGLRALHDLHLPHYLAYAALLLPCADAPPAVEDAFGDLARHWPQALATASPAACAWQAVRHRVRTRAGPRTLRTLAHLNARQQDVLLLHLVLDLPCERIADLTGTEPAAVHAHLRSLATATRP
ncbi:sigma factor-like helix-turn-helix DNA-binding protein [Kitasatospora sp. NPDC051170]|uniref:sigma factor-like helix-turn-helix DNA-binding protein n=1 Tax=Kitasatospora sp. NPDC051170 TaxID=3364056 RepID=UPI0037A89450